MANLAPVTHILPLTTIRRDRMLPVPGKVLVRKGQKVAAADVIAEANLHATHALIDLARSLGMPADKADRYIMVETGTQVAEGDILAGPVGIMRRVVRSPGNATVVLVGGGQILLEVQTRPFELHAGLPGEVINLFAERGATIQTTGALIQGVWGNGSIDFGLMYALIKNPDDDLETDQLDVSMRGAIVLGGHCQKGEVLRAAGELPLRGLILASLEPELIPAAAALKIPVLVLEGFGKQPMNSRTLKLLMTNQQREVAVNAEKWDRFQGTRPEVIVPLPAPTDPPLPPETDFFAEGQDVRVTRAPYQGQNGTLIGLPAEKMSLPSGLRTTVGEIRLESGEHVLLPLANLEVLE